MEGFTIWLALVDAVPVLCFGAGMLLLAGRFSHPLFLIGAVLSTLAGCCKVCWKLILGIWKKDVSWLNKRFLPMQITGFLLMLAGFALSFRSIAWGAVLARVTRLPALVFFLGWLVLMGVMFWYRSARFSRTDARSNWIAQLVNCAGQGCLLLGILFS